MSDDDVREVDGGSRFSGTSEIQNEFYADREDAGDRENLGPQDRLEVVRDIIAGKRFDRLLDTRCGTGEYTMSLAEACGASEVYGFELYEQKLATANERGMEATRHDLNNAAFPFEDDYLDCIVAVDIIEHLYDPDHFLEEVQRTLRPDGTFVVATPNLASVHNRVALALGYQPFAMNLSRRYPVGHLFENHSMIADRTPPSSHHFRPFTLKSLSELLDLHGFGINQIAGSSAVLPEEMTLHSIFERLERALSRFPSLSYEIVVTCTPGGER